MIFKILAYIDPRCLLNSFFIDAKPNTAIYEVKEKVWKFKSYEPFPSQVKAVNTIISKNIVGKR